MQIKLIQKATSIAASAVLFGSTFAPVAFASVDEVAANGISGVATNNTTGADSTNHSSIVLNQDTTVVQNNAADITNNVNLKLNSGKNNANKNTGEGIVVSGDISSGVAISNTANTNVADLQSCGGCDMDIVVGNVKTGADSDNGAKVKLNKTNSIFQNNAAVVDNNIDVNGNTGKNNANKNTGGGSVESGDLTGTAIVENNLNQNFASLAGGEGTASITALNDTTGADSSNWTKVKANFNNVVTQTNLADIDNNVDLDLNSGKNDANKNTGWGMVTTGDVAAGVALNTTANANFLAFNDCCDITFDTGNTKTGYGSDNSAKAKLYNALAAFQTNATQEDNNVDGDLDTGKNETSKNTNDDIVSGDVEAVAQVESDSNHNVLGSVEAPDMDWDIEFPGNAGNAAWWMMWLGHSAH